MSTKQYMLRLKTLCNESITEVEAHMRQSSCGVRRVRQCPAGSVQPAITQSVHHHDLSLTRFEESTLVEYGMNNINMLKKLWLPMSGVCRQYDRSALFPWTGYGTQS